MSKLSEWFNTHFKHETVPTLPPVISDGSPVEVPDAPLVSEAELNAGQKAIREVIDESGYGSFVSDAQALSLATKVLIAAAKVRQS